jgi:hypothetical protein
MSHRGAFPFKTHSIGGDSIGPSHHTVCLMNYVPVLFDRLYEVCENLFKSFHNLIQVKCVQEVFTPVSTA